MRRDVHGIFARSGRHVLLRALLMTTAICTVVQAQGPPYTFTRIADTNTDAGLGGTNCVGINNLGHVSVSFVPSGAGVVQIWRGDGVTFTQTASRVGGLCFSVNDLDETAYLLNNHPTTGVTSLVRNNAGTLTILARSDTAPYLDGSSKTYFPSLSYNGSAVYHASGSPGSGFGEGLYIGPSGTAVYNSATDAPLSFFTTASMNDSSVVAFIASRPDPSAPSGARLGIYRGSDVPLIEDGDVVSAGTMRISLERPVINNSGTVAFRGSPSGSADIYTTSDGVTVTHIGTGSIQRLAINDAGTVAFRRGSGSGSGIFVGRPGSINEKVIDAGDALDGSIAQGAHLWEEAINNYGQVAFWAQLADGRRGVYRADPIWLKAVSFATTVPGCGPLNAKVTLTAPAPAGGLTVELASTNAAGGVPASVTVPQGKLSAAFKILTTAVTTKTTGAITATAGAQSLTRTLTVRPISVKTLTLSPNPVVAGNPVTGTVTLDCDAAPADVTVSLSSTRPGVATPAASSLVFSQGTKLRTFSVSTSLVAAPTSATIKASAHGITKSKKLIVNP